MLIVRWCCGNSLGTMLVELFRLALALGVIKGWWYCSLILVFSLACLPWVSLLNAGFQRLCTVVILSVELLRLPVFVQIEVVIIDPSSAQHVFLVLSSCSKTCTAPLALPPPVPVIPQFVAARSSPPPVLVVSTPAGSLSTHASILSSPTPCCLKRALSFLFSFATRLAAI
jgi:hypothetical protein